MARRRRSRGTRRSKISTSVKARVNKARSRVASVRKVTQRPRFSLRTKTAKLWNIRGTIKGKLATRKAARKVKTRALGKKIWGLRGDANRQIGADIGRVMPGIKKAMPSMGDIQKTAQAFGKGATEAKQAYSSKQKKMWTVLAVVGVVIAGLVALGLSLKKKVGL